MTANPILLQKNTAVSLSVLQSSRDFRWMRRWISFIIQSLSADSGRHIGYALHERCVFGRRTETGI